MMTSIKKHRFLPKIAYKLKIKDGYSKNAESIQAYKLHCALSEASNIY